MTSAYAKARASFVSWALTSPWHQHEFAYDTGLDADDLGNTLAFHDWIVRFCWGDNPHSPERAGGAVRLVPPLPSAASGMHSALFQSPHQASPSEGRAHVEFDFTRGALSFSGI